LAEWHRLSRVSVVVSIAALLSRWQ
jgi:hypothetical protein